MTGNRIIDFILWAITLLITAGTLGVFVYTEVIYQRPGISDQEQKEEMIKDIQTNESQEAVALGKITLNIQSDRPSARLRFLDVETSIVPFTPKGTELINENKKILIDHFIDVAGRMSPEELASISGRMILESRLKKSFEEVIGQQMVKEILFTSFVIQ